MATIHYFKIYQDVSSLKKQYQTLARVFHPDLGGDEEIMKEINNQYFDALKNKHGTTLKNVDSTDSKVYTYSFDLNVERELVDKLNEILGKKLVGIDCEIIGTWLWITGDTKAVRIELKASALNYHKKRECWYFTAAKKKHYYSAKGFDALRMQYGSVSNFKVMDQVK